LGAREDESWPRSWLSEPRFKRYLSESRGDEENALSLYVWNGKVAAALLRDIADAEVLVRNAFDRALSDSWSEGTGHWILDPASPILRVRWRLGKHHQHMDLNGLNRAYVAEAIRKLGGLGVATPGRILASLTFGFWVSMTSRAREEDLWVQHISRAFVSPHPTRRTVEARMRLINDLRNRVAHHEPLLKFKLEQDHERLLELCGWLDERVSNHIREHSSVPQLLTERP